MQLPADTQAFPFANCTPIPSAALKGKAGFFIFKDVTTTAGLLHDISDFLHYSCDSTASHLHNTPQQCLQLSTDSGDVCLIIFWALYCKGGRQLAAS
jgi:hypothetical protein